VPCQRCHEGVQLQVLNEPSGTLGKKKNRENEEEKIKEKGTEGSLPGGVAETETWRAGARALLLSAVPVSEAMRDLSSRLCMSHWGQYKCLQKKYGEKGGEKKLTRGCGGDGDVEGGGAGIACVRSPSKRGHEGLELQALVQVQPRLTQYPGHTTPRHHM